MFKDNRWKLALGYNLACLHSCNLFLHLCSLACTVLNKKKKKRPWIRVHSIERLKQLLSKHDCPHGSDTILTGAWDVL